MQIKKQAFTSKKLGSWNFWHIANSVVSLRESAIPSLFHDPKVLSSAFDKVKSFAEIFSKNSNLDGSGIYLPALHSTSKMKLVYIP